MDQQYVIHNIEESLSLPPEVLSIVEHFNAPLTPDLATITRKSLSLGSFEIHQEALASPVPSLLDVSVDKTRLENTTKDSKEIPNTFIDLVLVPLMGLGFITTLGFKSSEDAFLISGMPFLLPRTVGLAQSKPTAFEGKASLLIAWVIPPKKKTARDQVEGKDSQHEKVHDEFGAVKEENSQCGSDSEGLDGEVTAPTFKF